MSAQMLYLVLGKAIFMMQIPVNQMRIGFELLSVKNNGCMLDQFQKMAPKQPNTGLFVGLNKGHIVTKKELAPRPSDRKGVSLFYVFFGQINVPSVVLNRIKRNPMD